MSFAVAIALVTLVLSGAFRGPRAKWGGVALGLFLVIDLGRANQPWIIVWDYARKYATNPIIERMREKPWQQRVAILPSWFHQMLNAPAELGLLDQLYRIEWAQHHFQYYNIQSIDLVQMPRMPEDLAAFEGAFQPRRMEDLPRLVPRRWQLTNTRYLLGPADFVPFLNQQLDPQQQRFKIAERFNVVPKDAGRAEKLEDLTAQPATNGTFALIEFAGALPRVGLYANWMVQTNAQTVLDQLTNPSFRADQTVLLAEPLPGNPAAAGTNVNPGTVEFASYTPKHIALKARATTNCVLLLNDRYDPNWKVLVDGKPAPLLKPNYLMRGVFLTPGEHQVEFSFIQAMRSFYVSVAALAVGALLALALLLIPNRIEPHHKTGT